jgi:two-component system, NtrC family, response regulator AtoC
MIIHSREGQVPDLTARARLDHNQYYLSVESAAMRALQRTIADIAPTDIPVLLFGESGTGKEMIALELHCLSKRRDAAFVKCGCAGLTVESLLARLNRGEGDLAGEMTTGGSLFLDEISHLDLENQARFLDLLPDSAAFSPENALPVRLISSTTRNLAEEMRHGRFRQELYYRINGVYLHVPPLRHRKEDIPGLLYFFLKKYAFLFERPEPRLSPATMDRLLQHAWPGNVRELENVARKFVALGNEELVTSDLGGDGILKGVQPAPVTGSADVHPNGRSLKEAAREASRHAERELILKQLERTRWNRKKAARELQISYKALLYKLKQLDLDGSANSDGQ